MICKLGKEGMLYLLRDSTWELSVPPLSHYNSKLIVWKVALRDPRSSSALRGKRFIPFCRMKAKDVRMLCTQYYSFLLKWTTLGYKLHINSRGRREVIFTMKLDKILGNQVHSMSTETTSVKNNCQSCAIERLGWNFWVTSPIESENWAGSIRKHFAPFSCHFLRTIALRLYSCMFLFSTAWIG